MPIRSGKPFSKLTRISAGLTSSSTTLVTPLVGTVEEANEADVRALFDTNYFGQLRVIQAALPLLRQQGSGHILGVSSSLGIAAMPLIGFYCATKWAVEALHESLAQEVKSFGIKVTLLEPGAYATDFGSPASLKITPGMDVYSDLRKRVSGRLSSAVLYTVDCFHSVQCFAATGRREVRDRRRMPVSRPSLPSRGLLF